MTSIMKHTLAITIEEFLNLPENLSVMRKILSDIHTNYSGIWFVLRGNNIYWEERDFSYVVVNSGDILISDIDFENGVFLISKSEANSTEIMFSFMGNDTFYFIHPKDKSSSYCSTGFNFVERGYAAISGSKKITFNGKVYVK